MAVISCPLCCNNSFSSQHELVKHLMNILDNIHCPLCQIKLSSITSLVKHLDSNNCQIPNISDTVVYIDYNNYSKTCQSSNDNSKPPSNDSKNEDLRDWSAVQSTEVNSEMRNMFVELLPKDTVESSLDDNQELRFIRINDEDQFIFLDNEDITSSRTVIASKLNSDGTISLTTENVKTHVKEDTQEKTGPTYSCNTCGITFTSVLDHIQNYHNDQDVVVEDNIEEPIIGNILPIEYNMGSSDETATDKQGRRVITDAGSIIQTPEMLDVDPLSEPIPVTDVERQAANNIQENSQNMNKQQTSSTRRYALVEKFCDSYVMDIKKKEEKCGPYHKVVLKEMQTLEDGNKVKVFNCISCNTYVTNLDDLKDQPCSAKYPCPHCRVFYDNMKSLSAHMKVHKAYTSKELSSAFKCELCCTEFSTNKSLKLHKRMHDPIKPRPIEPPVQASKTEEVVDKFLCSICDKEIPLDYRSVHEKSHSNEITYNCDVCNRKFTSVEFMDMHVKLHKIEKVATNKPDKTLLYSCSYCPRQFARPHEKVKHERIHTGEKPHSCDICGKSFRVSYCLTLHMRTHTGARPYECYHCGKKFKAHSVYNHHLLTHSDVRAYKCPYCPKAFKTSVQLAGHKNSHTKPFACQYCNRPFASLYAVRVHSETHKRQNNLKFACQLCGATYARTFALKDHMRQAHKEEDIKVTAEDWLGDGVQKNTVKDLLAEEKTDN